MMQNLDQIRAANAIQYIDKEFHGQEGGEVVKKVPTMIRENGFLATAAFAIEKKGKDGVEYKNLGHKEVLDCIIRHLAHKEIGKLEEPMNLEEFVKLLVAKDSAFLRDITTEAMAYLNYLRRFARKK